MISSQGGQPSSAFLVSFYQLLVRGKVFLLRGAFIPPLSVPEGYLLFPYKARHAHKGLYTVLPKYSKIQVLPGITSCRLVKDNKQAIELNSLLINNMPKDGYG